MMPLTAAKLGAVHASVDRNRRQLTGGRVVGAGLFRLDRYLDRGNEADFQRLTFDDDAFDMPFENLRHRCHTPTSRHEHPGQAYCTRLTLAEWLCRTVDRIDPARVYGPRHCFGRGTSAPDSKILR
jgi:hypothetical protein